MTVVELMSYTLDGIRQSQSVSSIDGELELVWRREGLVPSSVNNVG